MCAAAALALLPTTAAASERAPGDVFYRCRIEQKFGLPGFLGTTPVFAQPGRPNNPIKPGDEIERIDAGVEVDQKDSALSNLSISWVQSGLLGFPYVWRADLHPVYLIASFSREGALPADGPGFDPARLIIKIDVVSAKRLDRTLDFRLWRDDQDKSSLTLGGPADVPMRRKSAEVRIAWPELAAYARGHRWLHYGLYRSKPFRLPVSEGRIDLSIMPALLDRFRKAEQALMANIPARRGCTPVVVPQPSEQETI